MAYSIQSSFNQFHDTINLAGDHRATAKARMDNIVSLLGNHFEIIESFGSGSVPRLTAFKGHADLDVMVALHYGKHIKNKTPTQVLQAVRDALGEYRSQVRKNGQAVTLNYKTWPNVDIVPVSQSVDVNKKITHYNVPDANTQRWIASNPKTHSEHIDRKASKCGPSFRRIVKMIKVWNASHSSYLQSYHIEVTMLRAFDSALTDLPWDIFLAFQKCHELVGVPLWHEQGWVDEYLSSDDREQTKRRLAIAEEKSRTAWYLGTNGKIADSLKCWRQLFGSDFPAYG